MEQEGGASQLLGTLRGGAGCSSNPGDNANGPCVLRAAQVLDTNPLRAMLLDSLHFVLPSVQMRKQPQRPAVTSQDRAAVWIQAGLGLSPCSSQAG